MGMPVKVMDYWTDRYQDVIRDRINKLQDSKSESKRKLLESKREDFYKANGVSNLLKSYEDAKNKVEVTHTALMQSLEFMFSEANKKDSNKEYSYGYSTPHNVADFKRQFDKLILENFDKWWENNTEEGKQIKELREMQSHVKDAVYASATPKNLLDGLDKVMTALNADKLLNGGAKPLLEELNEVVIQQ